jgi:uncharacterized protein (DUF885 family)
MATSKAQAFNPRTKTKWDGYTACGIAEGFDDPDNDFGTLNDKNIEAWAYLISTGDVWHLQGWYGRQAAAIIDGGTIDKNGHINWVEVDNHKEDL